MSLKTGVLVIGAGPGGYVAAIRLARRGHQVALVDKDALGGECLNYGCIPSKALIAAAGLWHRARKASEIGLDFGPSSADPARLQAWRRRLIGGMNRAIASLEKGNGVAVLQGEARFLGPREAEVRTSSGAERVEFDSALIATGSRALEIPGFSIDGKAVIANKQALELPEIPARLAVIGAGVIGLEIGTLYAKLGSKVTVVEMLPRLLAGIEPELTQPVARTLSRLGVEVLLNARAKGWGPKDGALELAVETQDGPRAVAADRILLSVGRSPSTQGLGLEAAGVKVDPKGFIPVDEGYRTTASNIYAIGDVIGPPFLAHKASREASLAAEAISGQTPEPLGPVPWAIFTDPEIAAVGLTEAEARAAGRDPAVGRFPFSASGRAQTARETDGFVKVVADRATGRLLGAGIAGPSASDLIAEAALALRLKATLADVAATIHPHPTLSEAFHEACEAAAGEAVHILGARPAAPRAGSPAP